MQTKLAQAACLEVYLPYQLGSKGAPNLAIVLSPYQRASLQSLMQIKYQTKKIQAIEVGPIQVKLWT